MVVCYIIMTILGAALIVYGIKKSKLIMVGGILLAGVGLFLVVCTIILASAVRNSEPNPKFDNEENGYIIGSSENDETYINTAGNEAGADWRTWRSYSNDYVISKDVTVCLSYFDDGSGFAVYNSSNGDRIGSLVVRDASGNKENVSPDTVIKCEDTNSDGVSELGVVISPERTVWFKYTGEAWKEGVGGGCFLQTEEK